MNAETPIAWTALQEGTPVHASGGEELGRVTAVVADQQKDIFSGLAYSSGLLGTERFVPAELVGSITDKSVTLTIPADQAETLEPY